MHKDAVDGSGEQVHGAFEEAVGRLTGDSKFSAYGTSDVAEGELQSRVREAREHIRDVLRN